MKEKAFRKVCYVVVSLLTKRPTYMYREIAEYITIAVTMAKRIHLFPFRTQKLSSFTPKVLTVNRWEDR